MRYTDMKVNRMEQFSNRPRVTLTVEDIPPRDAMRFTKVRKRDGMIYYGELDGAVRFFAHNPKDQSGYGGDVFELHMVDGTIERIKGPWSSRAGVMNSLPTHLPQTVEVNIVDIQGNTHYHAVTLEWLMSQGFRMGRLDAGGETIYEILNSEGRLLKPISEKDSYYTFIEEV